jgi:4-hydroxythreonine-4-phosphate dehydrogenase
MTLKANCNKINNCPIAVSIGDPAGIGPEIIVKAWQQKDQFALPPFFLLGCAKTIESFYPNLSIKRIEKPAEASEHFKSALPIIDIPAMKPVVATKPSPMNAQMVLDAIEQAVQYIQSGEALALVTAPINKNTLYEAGFTHKGHTDYLAHLVAQDENDAVMMLHSDKLSVVPLSIHIALKNVPKSITSDKIIKTATIMFQALVERFGFSNPRIAVTGLNPHAGENGSMGDEEINIITPAIKHLQDQGHAIFGPFAADSLFSEGERRKYDAILAMYHDQALAPFKALDMRNGVNITLGLKNLIRTSPDHGTAYDIAGKNIADPNSMIQAIMLAYRLSQKHDGGLSQKHD